LFPDGKGSNYMCDLQVGDIVTGSGPYGSMRLRNRDKDLIFIAGGSGMAPIKSLLEELFSESFENSRGSSMVFVRKRSLVY
jgi:NAD(P)H-flavin reductase